MPLSYDELEKGGEQSPPDSDNEKGEEEGDADEGEG